MGAPGSIRPSSQGLRAGDSKAGEATGVETTDTEVLETRETNGTRLGIVSREDRQLGTDRHPTEHLGLTADIHGADRHEAADDDLGSPKGCHQTSLQQVALGFDVENVPAKLPQIGVVSRVHKDASNTQIVAFDERESIREHVTTDRCDDGGVGVDRTNRVEAVGSDSIEGSEDTLVFGSLDLGTSEVLRPLDEIEATLLHLCEWDLRVGGDLKQGEDDTTGLGDSDDIFTLLPNHERGNVGVLVIYRQSAIWQLLDQECFSPDRMIIATKAKGLSH